MKTKIEAGQWWETGLGKRLYIACLTSQVPGMQEIRRQPVIAVTSCGGIRYYGVDGQYYFNQASGEDLKTLLPPECDSFDWEPEPKWRDARPEDLTYPNKAARFRDHNCDMWENGTLVGIAYRGDMLVWVDSAQFHYWQCQVQEDTCK